VTSVRRVDWGDSRAGGFMFVFRPGLIDTAPHGFIAFARGPSATADRARLLSTLAQSYPNVSVVDGREMLATIATVVDNITLAVTVVGSLVVVSGLLILIGAVAMTKFRRVYEAAILKTLGATRRVIATMLLLEYGVLGALAGILGAAGAAGLTWALSRFAFDMPFRSPTALLGFGVAACAVIVSAVGVVVELGRAPAPAALHSPRPLSIPRGTPPGDAAYVSSSALSCARRSLAPSSDNTSPVSMTSSADGEMLVTSRSPSSDHRFTAIKVRP
jgi:predicted lysophospholipase L1 biosynthesis ABC-type transport system permease subunit